MISAVAAPLHPDPLLPAVLADQEGRAFTVRPLHAGDRGALAAFYATFEPTRAAQGLPPEGPVRVARWLDRILPTGLHLAVEQDGALVGHAMLIPTDGDHADEYAIFLHQEVRGRGLGTAINRLAVELARAAGIRRLWLSVEPDNRAAIRSYEKAGWRYIPASLYSSELEMELLLDPG